MTRPQQIRPPKRSYPSRTVAVFLQADASYVVVQALNGPNRHVAAGALKELVDKDSPYANVFGSLCDRSRGRLTVGTMGSPIGCIENEISLDQA